MNERLAQLRALAGEHFDDYLVVVRKDGLLHWAASDRTWAAGAAKRYGTIMDEEDRARRRAD